MNSGRSVFSWVSGVMLIALASAQAQPSASHGRPVVFSDPKRDDATTNLNQSVSKRMTLQSVEDGLKQMNILDLADPTRREATISAPHVPPPNFNTRQFKNQSNKKDWLFKTQEDFESEYGLTVEQIFKVPKFGADGRPKKEQSALERYYDRLEGNRTASTNSMTKDDPLFGDKRDSSDDHLGSRNERRTERASDFPSPSEQALKRLTGESVREAMERSTGKPRTIADLFGINEANSPAALREQRQQEVQIEKFKKLLDPGYISPILDPNVAAAKPAQRAAPGLEMQKPLGTLSGSPSTFNSLPSISGTALQPPGLPEVPRLPDFNTPLPKPETPAPAAATPPGFALPKRKF